MRTMQVSTAAICDNPQHRPSYAIVLPMLMHERAFPTRFPVEERGTHVK